jgi:hypothetical protein
VLERDHDSAIATRMPKVWGVKAQQVVWQKQLSALRFRLDRFDLGIEVPFWRTKVEGAKAHGCPKQIFGLARLRNRFTEQIPNESPGFSADRNGTNLPRTTEPSPKLNSFEIEVSVILSRRVTDSAPVIQIKPFVVSCGRFENLSGSLARKNWDAGKTSRAESGINSELEEFHFFLDVLEASTFERALRGVCQEVLMFSSCVTEW